MTFIGRAKHAPAVWPARIAWPHSAYARGDTPAATSLLQRAVALYPSDDPRRLRLLPPLGRTLIEVGETSEAESVLSEAVDKARATGQRAVAMDAAVARSALRLHTNSQVGQPEVLLQLEAAIPFFEESGDKAPLARGLGLAGNLRFWRGEAAAAIEDLERAACLAGEAGESAQEVESLQYVLVALQYGPTPVGEALARVEELKATAEHNRPLQVHVLRAGACLQAMRGSFATARHFIEQAGQLAAELGLELTLARIALQAGQVELLAGDAVAAEGELRTAYEVLERMENWGYLTSVVPPLVDALLALGRDKEGQRLTDIARRHAIPEDVDAQIGWRRVRAKLLARRGDFEEGERLAHEAMAIAERTDFLELRARVRADLVEVLHRAGRPEESASALEESIRLFEQKGNVAAAGPLRDQLAEWQCEV